MARAMVWGWLSAVVLLSSGCAATSVRTFAYEQAHGGECITLAPSGLLDVRPLILPDHAALPPYCFR